MTVADTRNQSWEELALPVDLLRASSVWKWDAGKGRRRSAAKKLYHVAAGDRMTIDGSVKRWYRLIFAWVVRTRVHPATLLKQKQSDDQEYWRTCRYQVERFSSCVSFLSFLLLKRACSRSDDNSKWQRNVRLLCDDTLARHNFRNCRCADFGFALARNSPK